MVKKKHNYKSINIFELNTLYNQINKEDFHTYTENYMNNNFNTTNENSIMVNIRIACTGNSPIDVNTKESISYVNVYNLYEYIINKKLTSNEENNNLCCKLLLNDKIVLWSNIIVEIVNYLKIKYNTNKQPYVLGDCNNYIMIDLIFEKYNGHIDISTIYTIKNKFALFYYFGLVFIKCIEYPEKIFYYNSKYIEQKYEFYYDFYYLNYRELL